MSHWVQIKTEVKDLTALAAACRELGCQFVAKGPGRYDRDRIDVPGVPYPVYVDKTATGYTLRIESDFTSGYAAKLGPNCGKLMQLYGVHKVLAEAKRKGWAASRVTLPGGSVNVTINAGV